MNPEIFYCDLGHTSYLAIIKNGYVIDIACSSKHYDLYGQRRISKRDLFIEFDMVATIQAKDLALYTHWPVHTKEFWDLLNET
jgi:hypothetical protein